MQDDYLRLSWANDWLYLTSANIEPPYVFDNRDAAFQMLKKHRESRLKAFKTHDEAKSFSILGIENSTAAAANEGNEQTNGIKGECNWRKFSQLIDGHKNFIHS